MKKRFNKGSIFFQQMKCTDKWDIKKNHQKTTFNFFLSFQSFSFSLFLNFICISFSSYHYEPQSPIRYDNFIFINFWISKLLLAQIYPETSNFHRLGLKRLNFVLKCLVHLPKLGLKHWFLSLVLILLSKKPKAKSKHFSTWPFSEFFWKSLLLGALTSIQGIQKCY